MHSTVDYLLPLGKSVHAQNDSSFPHVVPCRRSVSQSFAGLGHIQSESAMSLLRAHPLDLRKPLTQKKMPASCPDTTPFVPCPKSPLRRHFLPTFTTNSWWHFRETKRLISTPPMHHGGYPLFDENVRTAAFRETCQAEESCR